MSDRQTIDEEERLRINPIAKLMLQQVPTGNVPNALAQWLSEVDMSLLYPEFAIGSSDSVTTDCPGVNSIELLRFFDKVIIRLDDLPSKDMFRDVYFMSPGQMAQLGRSGHFCILRTGRAENYPDFYAPIFNAVHPPQNDRLLIIAAIAKSKGDPERNPLSEMESRVRALAHGVWSGAPVRRSFMGNIKRLYTFGFEAVAEELLTCPSFRTAEPLAFHLANYLCRPYTDAIGHFSCESGGRLTDLRRRLESHKQIDLSHDNPDILFKKIAAGDRLPDLSELKPGMTFQGPVYEVELAAAQLWELLNGMILPMQTSIGIHSRRTIGDPLAAAEEVLRYPPRRECRRYFQEMANRLRSGDLRGAEVALSEVGRINDSFEESSRVRSGTAARYAVKYAALGLRRALTYVPLVGGMLKELADLGITAAQDFNPALAHKVSEKIHSQFDKWLPSKEKREEVFPMLIWNLKQ